MRICLALHELAPFRQEFIRQLAAAPDVTSIHILLAGGGSPSWQFEVPDKVAVETISEQTFEGTPSRLRAWLLGREKGRRLVAAVQRIAPDVVFYDGYFDAGYRVLMRYCRRQGCPQLLWIDSNIHCERAGPLKYPIKRIVVRRIFDSVSAVLVCGSLGRRYALKYGAEPWKIHDLPAEPDMALFESPQPLETPQFSPERRRFLCCGRLVPDKRVDLLLTAFSRLAPSRAEWDLVIVGDGPERQRLEAMVPPELRQRIVWYGHVANPQELSRIYRSCDVFVLPSDYEAWGVVVLEATCTGLAVIASDAAGAAAEVVRDRYNGYIFRRGSITSLTEAMCDASSDAAYTRLMGHRSRALYSQWQHHANAVPRFLQLVRDLVAQGKSGVAGGLAAPAGTAILKPRCTRGEGSWPPKRDLFGVGVSVTDYADAAQRIVAAAKERRAAVVDFLPVNLLTAAAYDEDFRNRLNRFDMVCPDGSGVRWCLDRVHHTRLPSAVTGTGTTLRVCEAAAREGIGIYLYGSTPQTLERLQQRLEERFPGLRIVGRESPPFRKLTAQEDEEVVRRIEASGAGIVLLGLGSFKQENFAIEHRDRIRAVQMCVGAAFDFLAGTKQRAPEWMQRYGLEWLYRMSKEPRRIGHRVLTGHSMFIWLLLTRNPRKKATCAG